MYGGRHFRLLMTALATVAGKSFNGKFTAKMDFPIDCFILPIADADFGSLKSLHTLFDKYILASIHTHTHPHTPPHTPPTHTQQITSPHKLR